MPRAKSKKKGTKKKTTSRGKKRFVLGDTSKLEKYNRELRSVRDRVGYTKAGNERWKRLLRKVGAKGRPNYAELREIKRLLR